MGIKQQETLQDYIEPGQLEQLKSRYQEVIEGTVQDCAQMYHILNGNQDAPSELQEREEQFQEADGLLADYYQKASLLYSCLDRPMDSYTESLQQVKKMEQQMQEFYQQLKSKNKISQSKADSLIAGFENDYPQMPEDFSAQQQADWVAEQLNDIIDRAKVQADDTLFMYNSFVSVKDQLQDFNKTIKKDKNDYDKMWSTLTVSNLWCRDPKEADDVEQAMQTYCVNYQRVEDSHIFKDSDPETEEPCVLFRVQERVYFVPSSDNPKVEENNAKSKVHSQDSEYPSGIIQSFTEQYCQSGWDWEFVSYEVLHPGFKLP